MFGLMVFGALGIYLLLTAPTYWGHHYAVKTGSSRKVPCMSRLFEARKQFDRWVQNHIAISDHIHHLCRHVKKISVGTEPAVT